MRHAQLVVALFVASPFLAAQAGPQPPCDGEAVAVLPAPGAPARISFWHRTVVGRAWKPPACTGWLPGEFNTLVATAARFRVKPEDGDLLTRIGAISRTAGTLYWSTTHKQWRTLITEAHALKGAGDSQPRPDFTAEELTAGAVLYFEQNDNLAGKAIYRLHVSSASPRRIVFDIENVQPLRFLSMTVLKPGELQYICFLVHEPDDVWQFYSIVRTGRSARAALLQGDASVVNRAAAWYRHLVGIPTDQEPPASP